MISGIIKKDMYHIKHGIDVAYTEKSFAIYARHLS